MFTDIIAMPDLGSWALYVAVILPAVAALLYIVAVPYSKRRYSKIANMGSIKEKLDAYISFQAHLKIIIIALSVVMAVVAVLVKMELMMLACMALLVELLVYRCMVANPYTIKQRLQLTDDEMNELYGEGWEEKK